MTDAAYLHQTIKDLQNEIALLDTRNKWLLEEVKELRATINKMESDRDLLDTELGAVQYRLNKVNEK